jgi:hypothetical protein
MEENKKTFLALSEEEPLMPVRIHFRVRKKKVYQAFQNLSSVDYDKEKKLFEWFYEPGMDADYKFDGAQLPKGQSMVLAQMKFKGDKELVLLTQSYRRAIAAVDFFMAKTGAGSMRLYQADLANWMYENTPENREKLIEIPFDFFDDKELFVRDPEILQKYMEEFKEKGKSEEEAFQLANDRLDEDDRKQYPEFETREVGPTDEDLIGLKFALILKQRVAMHRFAGQEGYSLNDAVEELDKEMFPDEQN